MLDKETFRKLDMYRIGHGTGGRFDRVYEDPGQRVDDDVKPEEIRQRVKEREEAIEKALQKVFDDQVSRSPLLSRYSKVAGKKVTP